MRKTARLCESQCLQVLLDTFGRGDTAAARNRVHCRKRFNFGTRKERFGAFGLSETFLADLWRDLGNALPIFFQKASPTFPFWYPFCMYMYLAACHGFNISFFIRLCDCALPFPIYPK